jgi:hypothetical protein
MGTTASSFTLRKNAKRAAEAMIRKGTAPAVDYDINPSGNGWFEIVWKIVKAAPTSDEGSPLQWTTHAPRPLDCDGSLPHHCQLISPARLFTLDTLNEALQTRMPSTARSGSSETAGTLQPSRNPSETTSPIVKPLQDLVLLRCMPRSY